MIEKIIGKTSEIENRIRNIIRIGVVKVYNPEKHTAVVEIKDIDKFSTTELPVMTSFSHKDKAYMPLNSGQKVVCVFPSNGDNTDGFVLGSVFDKDNPPPVKDARKFRIEFEDGTYIEYDKKTHHLAIKVNGSIEITATGNIVLKGARIDLNP